MGAGPSVIVAAGGAVTGASSPGEAPAVAEAEADAAAERGAAAVEPCKSPAATKTMAAAMAAAPSAHRREREPRTACPSLTSDTSVTEPTLTASGMVSTSVAPRATSSPPPPRRRALATLGRRAFHLGNPAAAVLQAAACPALHPRAHLRRRRWTHARLERDGHRLGRGEAAVRVLRQSTQHERVELLGDGRVEGPRWRHRVLDDLADDGGLVVGLEQALPGERLPEDDGGGVDVGLHIDRHPAQLLGGHVRELSFDLAVACGVHPAEGLGHPEVDDAGDAVEADEQVLGRDVAVHERERSPVLAGGFVRRMQAAQGLADDRRRDRHRDVFACRPRQTGERFAEQVLHDEEQLAVLGDDVEGRYDVGVTDPGGQARFVEEHRDELGVFGELRVQALDRDGPGEPRRPAQPSQVNGGHPARGELVVDRVAPDDERRSQHPFTVP